MKYKVTARRQMLTGSTLEVSKTYEAESEVGAREQWEQTVQDLKSEMQRELGGTVFEKFLPSVEFDVISVEPDEVVH
jgi:D-alanyl-D-alanine carboxypeptidase